MKGAAKWILTAVGVIAVGVIIYLFLPKKGKVIKEPPPLVEVTAVDTQTVTRSVDLIGYIAPVRQTAAVSRAYGKVTSINVTEGQEVYKNQVLMTLQPEEVGLEYKPQPVKAPISGVVAEVMVREGEPVQQGSPVVAIIDPAKIEVELAVAGEYYNDIQTSDQAYLVVNSDTIPARIKSKSPIVDPMTRTFGLTLTPNGTSPHFVSGLSVTVRLILDERPSVLAIPNSAISDAKVIVVSRDSVVEYRNLILGLSGVEKTQILEGINAGEWIVTFGGQNLVSGQRVRVALK
ncbi:efflux RND transporter periplasmic adaptor subunit [candidate division WOR-3 bacterium]|nr:efflux RND transporter periplasmic adaptor subunit [candidate division WOR-3 bacterium]